MIESGSYIKLYNWRIFQNFGITSGLIEVSDDGYFEIYGSTIYQNYGMMNIIAEITTSSYLSIIDSSTIYNNENIYQDDIISEFNETWRLLWFVPINLRSYIMANHSIYNYSKGSKLFEFINSNFAMQNGTVVYNQHSILKSFLTTITLNNIAIYSMIVGDNWFRLAQSTINMTNIFVYNISSYDSSNFVYADFSSIVSIKNTSYTNSLSPFLYATTSEVYSESLILNTCYTIREWILILSSPAVSLTNSNISDWSSNNSTSSFSILSSAVNSISNLTISNMNQHAVNIQSSNITIIEGMVVNQTYGVYSKNSNIQKILNSTFTNNGRGANDKNTISIKGGGAFFENSNFTITLSTFSNNTSKSGAGVFVSWKLNPIWVTSISNSTFSNNVAEVSGGGIMYDLYRPAFSNLKFDNNVALYGPDIGSYAIQIKIGNSTQQIFTVSNAASGHINQEFKFSIQDFDNQIMNLDSTSKIIIKANTNGSQVDGKNIGVAHLGIVNLNELIFINKPGSQNVIFSVNSDSINLNIAKAIYGPNYSLPVISVNFRFCRPGEYISQTRWISCSQNSYSLMWNSTQWEQWMNNAYWDGDEIVEVDAGYWRKSTNSTFIVQWPNQEAWRGGYNTTNTYPVNWGTGYNDILWAKWTKVGEDKYEKVSNFQWAKWAAPIIIYIRMLGVGIAFILMILFITYN